MQRSTWRGRKAALAALLAALIPAALTTSASATPPALTAVTWSGDTGALSEPAYIIGHDRGQSAYYSSGSTQVSVWSFGDTATWNGGWASNTVGSTTDLNMSNNISSWTYDNMSTSGTGRPGNAVALPDPYPARNADLDCTTCYRNWAGMMAADPANHRIVMLYHIIGKQTKTGGDVDKGYGVAVRDMNDSTPLFEPHTITNASLSTNPYLLWYNPDPAPTAPGEFTTFSKYASGFMKEGNYFYAYSCSGPYGGDCKVARVDAVNPASVYNRSAWRFWNNGEGDCTTWSSSSACASYVESGDSGGRMTGGSGGMSVFWNPGISKFVQVYAAGASIRYRVASAPEGPWSKSDLIAQGKDGTAYAAYAHPEYAEDGGLDQYITYYHDTSTSDPEFRIVKATFSTAGATFAHAANTEAYFAQDSTVRVNAQGPTKITSTTTEGSGTALTADSDRQGTMYQQDLAGVGTSVAVRLDAQTSGTTQSLAGLVMRNELDGSAHAITANGRGYVVLAKRGSTAGGVVLRGDSDGDGDLDSSTGLAPISVTGAVWLKLTRTSATGYTGSFSQDSTNGVDGTWTSAGTVTVSTAAAVQDAGVFASGPDNGTDFNKGTFSNFGAV